MSVREIISNSTCWMEATAVYLSSNMTFTLTETTGGGAKTSNVAAGTYTKETFATAFAAALTAVSANSYTYTVISDQINYAQIPNETPLKYGSSFTITKTGAGNFFITIP